MSSGPPAAQVIIIVCCEGPWDSGVGPKFAMLPVSFSCKAIRELNGLHVFLVSLVKRQSTESVNLPLSFMFERCSATHLGVFFT